MTLPNQVLSTVPVPSTFLPPRNFTRFSPVSGRSDVHMGGIAIADASHGLLYQLWTAVLVDGNVLLSAPNTPQFTFLSGLGTDTVWVALAFDQNARPFIAYANTAGVCHYHWFNPIVNNFVTDLLPRTVLRPFASVDDQHPAEIAISDIILAYVSAGILYFRAQRDRYTIEYTLGPAPATLVQVGMSHVTRFQFAFQNVQGNGSALPPAEWNLGLGINEPA